jgi:PAS domain S-box-containing protein
MKDGVWNIEALKLLVENIPVMVSAHHGTKYIYVNSAYQEATGYAKEELLQKNFWDVAHPDYRGILKARGLARLRGEAVPTKYEVKYLKKNGEERWLNLFFALVTIRKGKNMSISAAVDITESKRLKEELQCARDELETRVIQRTEELNRKNEELNFLNQSLNNVLRNMMDGVVTVSRSGDFEILNPFFTPKNDKIYNEVKTRLKELFLHGQNRFINDIVDRKKPFKDEEIKLATSHGPLHLLASGTPILGEEGAFNRGVIMLRPIRDVHRLVNRISGARATFHFEDIITGNPVMKELIKYLKASAASISNILISGESGTGKELFVQAIHNESPRRKGPFLAVNCGAIPRELIGSELFGYAEGAFSGAKKGGNPGKFELAHEGTLFFDEIGDMPLEQQVALLRVLQERTLMRIGGREEVPVDVRIVCATNKDLVAEIQKGSFRKDLYYRLNVISVKIPPLRDRRDDVTLLFGHFLKMAGFQFNKKVERIGDDVTNYLLQYNWPGNVRELQNVVERMLHNMDGCFLSAQHLPSEVRLSSEECILPILPKLPQGDATLTLNEARTLGRQWTRDAETRRIATLLEEHGGNISRVAKAMGVARSTIYKKMGAK